MSTTPAFGTQIIGQTEKALNALLDQQLPGTGLTEPQWVPDSDGQPVGVTDAGSQLHRRIVPPWPRSPSACGATYDPKIRRPPPASWASCSSEPTPSWRESDDVCRRARVDPSGFRLACALEHDRALCVP